MENKPVLHQKGRYGLQFRGTECTNCSHPLDVSDRFCPNCSQANSTKKPTLKDFFDEFFASLISYDSRLLKTLSALLFRPGKITRDYLKGQRISYTNPFRFLLSLSIIYFLMLNLSSDVTHLDRYGAGSNESFMDFTGSLSQFMNDDTKEELNQIEDVDADQIIKSIDSLNITGNLAEIISKKDSTIMSDPKGKFVTAKEGSFLKRFFNKIDIFNAIIKADKVYNFDEISADYSIAASRENKAAFNAAQSYKRFKQQPGSFLSSIISRLPFAVFFFLPVFTMFIWLTYIRKKHTYTEHLIFSFHNQSLLFILLIISFLIDSVFVNVDSSWIFIILFSLYLFQAMRKFYEQGFFKTIVKFAFLNTIFFILALFGIILLFTGSLFTY